MIGAWTTAPNPARAHTDACTYRRVIIALLATAIVTTVTAFQPTGSNRRSSPLPTAAPLQVVAVPIPRFRVRGYESSGTYPQVNGGAHLGAVNAALRAAVVADQRAYALEARSARAYLDRNHPNPRDPYRRGFYRMAVERPFVSASTVVVSALLPAKHEAFGGQPGGDDWFSTTVLVPSGRRVEITDLFRDRSRGLQAFGRAWKAQLRRQGLGACLDGYGRVYEGTVGTHPQFALTPNGLAVGIDEEAACYALGVTIPYRALRRHMSKLGMKLIAGVRRPSRCKRCVGDHHRWRLGG